MTGTWRELLDDTVSKGLNSFDPQGGISEVRQGHVAFPFARRGQD